MIFNFLMLFCIAGGVILMISLLLAYLLLVYKKQYQNLNKETLLALFKPRPKMKYCFNCGEFLPPRKKICPHCHFKNTL